jgi:hypothetical protein
MNGSLCSSFLLLHLSQCIKYVGDVRLGGVARCRCIPGRYRIMYGAMLIQ